MDSWEESDLMGAFLVRCGEAPAVWQIEVQEGYTLQEVLQALGRMAWQALHDVKHGQAPPEKEDMHEPVEALRAVE
jgi:hypothetical protein